MIYNPWSGSINFPGAQRLTDSTDQASAIVPNLFLIPLDSSPNQTLRATVSVDGNNLTLQFFFRYNDIGRFWSMGISDQNGNYLVDQVPLVTGKTPASNLLEQYAYLKIGSAYIVPIGGSDLDYPDDSTLGSAFALLWGDTPQ